MKEGFVYKFGRGLVYGIGTSVVYGAAVLFTKTLNPLNFPPLAPIDYYFSSPIDRSSFCFSWGFYMTLGGIIGSFLEKPLRKISKAIKIDSLNYITKKIRREPIVKGVFYGGLGSAVMDITTISIMGGAGGGEYVPWSLPVLLSINTYMVLSGGIFGSLIKIGRFMEDAGKIANRLTTRREERLEEIVSKPQRPRAGPEQQARRTPPKRRQRPRY